MNTFLSLCWPCVSQQSITSCANAVGSADHPRLPAGWHGGWMAQASISNQWGFEASSSSHFRRHCGPERARANSSRRQWHRPSSSGDCNRQVRICRSGTFRDKTGHERPVPGKDSEATAANSKTVLAAPEDETLTNLTSIFRLTNSLV